MEKKSKNDNDVYSKESVLTKFMLEPQDIVMTKRVGAGAFGEVFKGTCMGETVAIKTMLDVTEDNVKEFKDEILLTATLRHPNIVNYVGACWGRELMCLVLEWVGRGSLRDFLNVPGADLRWDDPLLRLATDIARGMNYLHCMQYYDERDQVMKQCILHRDLKPDNALISDYLAAKLADFGTSKSVGKDASLMTGVGTPLYVAPEVTRGEMYDEKIDVYSFGMTLIEMCVGDLMLLLGERWMKAFDKKKIPKQTMRILMPIYEEGWRPVSNEEPVPQAPPSINDLIIRCMSHDPTRRPSFAVILNELNGKCKAEIDAKSYGRKTPPSSIKVSTSEDDQLDSSSIKSSGSAGSGNGGVQVESLLDRNDRSSTEFIDELQQPTPTHLLSGRSDGTRETTIDKRKTKQQEEKKKEKMEKKSGGQLTGKDRRSQSVDTGLSSSSHATDEGHVVIKVVSKPVGPSSSSPSSSSFQRQEQQQQQEGTMAHKLDSPSNLPDRKKKKKMIMPALESSVSIRTQERFVENWSTSKSSSDGEEASSSRSRKPKKEPSFGTMI
jgi:serine/threonine protein kinase